MKRSCPDLYRESLRRVFHIPNVKEQKGEVVYGAETHPTVVRFMLLIDAKTHLGTLPLPAIAKELGVSVSHLQHIVRKNTGKTCTKLIWQKCVAKMEAHLRNHPEKTIAEIAYQWGFDPKTMRRHFLVELGVSPSSVRKQGRS